MSPARRKRETFALCLLVFALAFAVRAGVMWAGKYYRAPLLFEPVQVAISLATKGTFADAYGAGVGPTAHCSPLYPLMLAFLLRVFGVAKVGLVARLFCCVLASLEYALLPLVAIASGLPRAVGVLAGVAAALLPISYWVQAGGGYEYPLTALLFVVTTLAILPAWRDRDFSVRRGSLIGLAWAVTMLAAPQFAPVMAALLIYPYVTSHTARKAGYWKFAAVQIVIVAAALAPWTIRNYKVLGAPIWSRSNLGLELLISNNPRASALWDVNDATHEMDALHPFGNPAETARVKAMGEVAYNRDKMAQAKAWIFGHPGRFLTLTTERVWYFWFPALKRRTQSIPLAMITALGIAGLFIFRKTRGFAFPYFLLVWAVFPLSAYLFQQSDRLRYPIEWTMFFFAAYLGYAGLRRSLRPSE